MLPGPCVAKLGQVGYSYAGPMFTDSTATLFSLPGRDAYTIPTVIMPDGEYIMDSAEIAKAVEKAFPEPSLHLDSTFVDRLFAVLKEIMAAILPVYIPLVPQRILNEASQPYWYETREAKVGMPLDQLAREKGGDPAWAAAAPFLRQVSDLLRENPQGPFFLGETPSYTDFIWGGLLVFLRRIGDDVLEKGLESTGDRDLHLKFLEAIKPWSERDSY